MTRSSLRRNTLSVLIHSGLLALGAAPLAGNAWAGVVTSCTVSTADDAVAAGTFGNSANTTNLRHCLIQANANPLPFTISFSTAGPIVLTEPLPLVLNNLTIDGGATGVTVDGNNQFRPFFVGIDEATRTGVIPGIDPGNVSPLRNRLAVTLKNLTIQNGKAKGGNGNGGGMGAGGAVFVNSAADVTLENVDFANNGAQGGNMSGSLGGGGMGGNAGSGGGGLFGAGSSGGGGIFGSGGSSGGGGGGYTGSGGAAGVNGGAGTRTPVGLASSGGDGSGSSPGSGGSNGGGGGGLGSGGVAAGGGGGFGGGNAAVSVGGPGGFGGGGGGGVEGGGNGGFGGGGGGAFGSTAGIVGGSGGFGGGGGSHHGNGGFGGGGALETDGSACGNGGFGGGGGGASTRPPGTSGIGAGIASNYGGGGGLGAGGAVFVASHGGVGGTLAVTQPASSSSAMIGGSVAGGTGVNNGGAAGSGLFLMSGVNATFDIAAGGSYTLSNDIGDDSTASLPSGGSFTPGGTSDGGRLVKNGAGTLTFSGTYRALLNAFVNAGTLVVAPAGNLLKFTEVNGGTLQLDGTAEAVYVHAAGTLSGTGTLGLIYLGGGTVAPGDSPGTLHANQLIAPSGTGAMAFQLGATNSTTDSDQLQLAGQFSKAAGVGLVFHFSDGNGPPAANTAYTLITFGGTNFTLADLSFDYTGARPDFGGSFSFDTSSTPQKLIFTTDGNTPVALQSFTVD